MKGRLGALALMWLSACGQSGKGGAPTEDASGGAAGGASLQPMLCPDGNEPGDDLAMDCPETMPEAGSCCGKAGLSCVYPGDETYHDLALCIDDEQHALFWQRTFAVDRLTCKLDSRLSELGAGAEACDTRVVEPCEPEGLTTPQELLNGQLDAIAQACGEIPNESNLEVSFEGGCATQLSESLSGPPGSSDDVLDCIREALDVHHFACAEELDCARIERSTLK